MITLNSLSDEAENSEYKISVLYPIFSSLHSLDSFGEVVQVFPKILMENFLWKEVVVAIAEDSICGISIVSFWGAKDKDEIEKLVMHSISNVKNFIQTLFVRYITTIHEF